MTMAPNLRKLMLTAHVTSSVGWLGAVTSFLALAIVGVTTQDAQIMRAAYLGMELTAWCVIVPLSFASPLSGIVQSLGTTWGLFQHYWVLIKFLMKNIRQHLNEGYFGAEISHALSSCYCTCSQLAA
jgi:hypothetical protein